MVADPIEVKLTEAVGIGKQAAVNFKRVLSK